MILLSSFQLLGFSQLSIQTVQTLSRLLTDFVQTLMPEGSSLDRVWTELGQRLDRVWTESGQSEWTVGKVPKVENLKEESKSYRWVFNFGFQLSN